MNGRRWSTAETRTLHLKYPKLGAEGVARLLPGRTAAACNAKALREGVAVGDVRGYVRLGDVSALLGRHACAVHQAAKKDGAALAYTPAGSRKKVVLVKAAWAKTYERQLEEKRKNDRECGGWYSYGDLERLFGYVRRQLLAALRGVGPLSPFLAGVTVKEGCRDVYFNPWEVEAALAAWRRAGKPKGVHVPAQLPRAA